jgi:hypothetical protein
MELTSRERPLLIAHQPTLVWLGPFAAGLAAHMVAHRRQKLGNFPVRFVILRSMAPQVVSDPIEKQVPKATSLVVRACYADLNMPTTGGSSAPLKCIRTARHILEVTL